jgi:O-antigen ligase
MRSDAYGIRRPSAGVVPSRYLAPRSFEYLFYVQVFYSIMGPVIGISLNMLGIGILFLLAGCCAMRLGRRTTVIVSLLMFPIACAATFIAVQVLVHGESLLSSSYVRPFVPWILSLVVVQWLALRPGFLHRGSMAMFLVGCSTVPYLRAFKNAADRAGLQSGIGISNPNDLGAWFGFCCVYFAILGIESRRQWIRATAFVLSGMCLFIVGLTVSRAPLLAAALCIMFALRRVVKRGILPLLSFIVVVWLAFGLGFFERSASLYQQRGLEETGRFLVWPKAIERFQNAPLTGVGASRVNTYVPQKGIAISPHNSFLFIALASGIVPLVFYAGYWLALFRISIRAGARVLADAPFHSALLLYAFVISLNLNQTFMVPWTIITLGAVTNAGAQAEWRRAVAPPAGRRSVHPRGMPVAAGNARV